MVVDLARKVRIIFLCRLEHDLALFSISLSASKTRVYLGSTGELVRCEIDFAKGSLAYKATQGVVADRA